MIIRPDIQLVNQIDDSTCAHACMAMITGRNIRDIAEELPAPCGPSEYLPWLVLHNILPIQEHRLFLGEISLVTIPSRNKIGYLHFVLADLRNEDNCKIYDPQMGRTVDGIDRVHVTDLFDMHSWVNPVRLIDCTEEVSPGRV